MKLFKIENIHKAKLIGSLYFLLLGIFNLVATLLNGRFHLLDVIILILACLPLLINRKLTFLIYGLIACFVSLYIGFACLTFNLDPLVHTSQVSFNMGYLLAASSFFSSLLLIYVGVYSEENKVISVCNNRTIKKYKSFFINP